MRFLSLQIILFELLNFIDKCDLILSLEAVDDCGKATKKQDLKTIPAFLCSRFCVFTQVPNSSFHHGLT